MSSSSRKGSDNGDTQLDEGDLPRSEQPTIVEHGKKFAAYDNCWFFPLYAEINLFLQAILNLH